MCTRCMGNEESGSDVTREAQPVMRQAALGLLARDWYIVYSVFGVVDQDAC